MVRHGTALFYTFINKEIAYAGEADKDVALIYITSNQQPNEDVFALQEMLQTSTSVDVVFIEDVNERNLQQYKRIVILSSYQTKIPQNALSSINQFQGPVLLIGENALQFENFSTWHEGPTVELRAIGEESLSNPVRWKSIQPSADWEIVKSATSLNQSYPFIVTKDNWSFIGDFINKDLLLYQWPAMIGELLHLSKPQIHPAYIVLTDINMKTEVQQLEDVVMEFSEKESL